MTDYLAPDLDGADRAGRVTANGIELAYEQFGRDEYPALLLIMGLGTQLTAWPDAFCRALAETGLRVIRFDNRDIGLSTKMTDLEPGDGPRKAFLKSMIGASINTPYTLEAMAADTVGLMDALAIDVAHLAGMSMGGMIAQRVAIDYPQRVRTLTSIMSTTGARRLPRAKLKVLLRLTKAPPGRDTETIARHMATTMRMIGSPRLGRSYDDWVAELRRNVERSYYPAGTARQMLAVMAAEPRTRALRELRCPMLIIHGRADPLLPVKHGRATARAVRHARYEEVDGLGHDLPPPLLAEFVGWIDELVHADADRAS